MSTRTATGAAAASRPLRITFVCAVADLTGGFRVIAAYAERLRRRGHDVLVVSRRPRVATPRDVLRALYRRRPLPIAWWRAPTHLDATGVRHRVVDRSRPISAADLPDADVVVATWWETAEWVAALPPEKGAKVHFIQDYETWGGAVERVDATCRLPMPKITPSGWVHAFLADAFAQTDVVRIPNAVDLETFTTPPRGKQRVPTVGFTFTPLRAKGCDVVVDAIRLARVTRPDLRVVSFGTSQPTAEAPLPRGTDFRFRVPDAALKHRYAACDAWLFGTRREGFGLPLSEAMACRTPVIATRAGAAPDLLQDGGGFLVDVDDSAAMAAAIVQICAMPEPDWRALSERARATVVGWTWDDATDAFENALRRVCAIPVHADPDR